MNARLSILLTVSLFALGCSDADSGDTWGIDPDPYETRAEIDLGPSCTVPMFPDPNDTEWADASLSLPVGVTLEDARVTDARFGPFEDSDRYIETRFVGEAYAKAAVVEPESYGDYLADGLWYDLHTFDWSRRARAYLHDSLINSPLRHFLPASRTSSGDPSSFAVFAFYVETKREFAGRPDVHDNPDTQVGLQQIIDQYGIGYVDSVTYGGYEVLTVNLDMLNTDQVELLRRLISTHTDDEHNLDYQALAQSLEAQSPAPIPFAASYQRGLHMSDPETDAASVGDDIFASLRQAPSRLDEYLGEARNAVEDGERGSAPRVDYRSVRFERSQLGQTDLSASELDAFECYSDFLVEAHTAARSARAHAASARCFSNRAGDDSYADLVDPLETAADRIERRIDDCQRTLEDGGVSGLCNTCTMPRGATLENVRNTAEPIPMIEQPPLFAQPGDSGNQ